MTDIEDAPVPATSVRRALAKLNCLERHERDYYCFFVVESDGQLRVPPIVIPKRTNELASQIVKRIRGTLGLHHYEAAQLFECTMTRDKYFEISNRRRKK